MQVLIEASADVDDGCNGRLIGVVGGFQDTCQVNVSATDGSIVQDADTEIIADIIAEACEADEDVVVTVNATATVCLGPPPAFPIKTITAKSCLPCAQIGFPFGGRSWSSRPDSVCRTCPP